MERGTNVIDSGAPFYDVYETADGKWVSVAPIEMRFFRELLRRLDIDDSSIPDRFDRSTWPGLRAVLSAKFKSQDRAHWCALLEGTDACFAPVLSMDEVAQHPHVQARQALVDHEGVVQPAVAPRFSKTPGAIGPGPRTSTGAQAQQTLQQWFGDEHYNELRHRSALNGVRGTDPQAREA